MILDATQLALVTGSEALGAVVQGSVGFGLNVVAAPLLLLVDPRFVPVPVLMAGLIANLAVAYSDRHSIDLVNLGWALSGRVPGSIAGALALVVLTERSTEAMFGVVVLAAVGFSVAGWQLRPSHRALAAVGVLSGFMGTTASIGGPPLALVYQRETGPTVRGTLSAYGFSGSVLSLVALAAFGRVGTSDLGLSVMLLPGLALGYLASRRVTAGLDTRWVRPAVLGLVTLSAIAVLARSIGY